MPRKTTTMEAYVSVSDLGGDFEEIGGQGAILALENMKAEIGTKLSKRLWFGTPEFIECDSSNPTHACAYFNVEVAGEAADVDAAAEALEG